MFHLGPFLDENKPADPLEDERAHGAELSRPGRGLPDQPAPAQLSADLMRTLTSVNPADISLAQHSTAWLARGLGSNNECLLHVLEVLWLFAAHITVAIDHSYPDQGVSPAGRTDTTSVVTAAERSPHTLLTQCWWECGQTCWGALGSGRGTAKQMWKPQQDTNFHLPDWPSGDI